MKRISQILLLLVLVAIPVVLFVIDNQYFVSDISRKISPVDAEGKYKVTYSSFTDGTR